MLIKKRKKVITKLTNDEETKIKEIALTTPSSLIKIEVFYQVYDVELNELKNVLDEKISKGEFL